MNRSAREWDALARSNAAYSISARPEFEAGEAETTEAFWESGRASVAEILDAAALDAARMSTVVEIGCGIGRMTRALAERFAKVVALDISPEMIARAKALHPDRTNVDFRIGTGVDLAGVETASADLVLSWFVLQHVPRARDVLHYVGESARVLRPGGRAYLHMATSPSRVVQARRWFQRTVYYALPESIRRRARTAQHGSLETEFAVKYRAWRGTSVVPRDVERVGRRAGLRLVSSDPAGEGFTVFQFEKPAAS